MSMLSRNWGQSPPLVCLIAESLIYVSSIIEAPPPIMLAFFYRYWAIALWHS